MLGLSGCFCFLFKGCIRWGLCFPKPCASLICTTINTEMLIQRISYPTNVSVTSEIQNLFGFVRFVWPDEFKEVLGEKRKKSEILTLVIHHVFIVPVPMCLKSCIFDNILFCLNTQLSWEYPLNVCNSVLTDVETKITSLLS